MGRRKEGWRRKDGAGLGEVDVILWSDVEIQQDVNQLQSSNIGYK